MCSGGEGQPCIPIPQRVSGLSSIRAVALGDSVSYEGGFDGFGLALRSDGSVWGWGDNSYGQLGDGTTGPGQAAPFQVPWLGRTTAIGAGNFHSVATRADDPPQGGPPPGPTATPFPTWTPGPMATATPTVTSTPTPTPVEVPVDQDVPPPSGQTGTACTQAGGADCTASGLVTGYWSKANARTFSFTAPGPANALAGSIPAVFIPTLAQVEGYHCSAVSSTLSATCNGATVGDAVQGATISVRFALVGGGRADVTGQLMGPGPAQTGTATPTITPSPSITPSPYPQPNVGLQVAPSGNTLQSTIQARDAGCVGGNNQLQALRFTRLANATVDVATSPVASVTTPTTVTLPSHPATIGLTVYQVTAGQAVTVELTVTDGCGDWPTFVGGGSNVFGGMSPLLAASATPTPPPLVLVPCPATPTVTALATTSLTEAGGSTRHFAFDTGLGAVTTGFQRPTATSTPSQSAIAVCTAVPTATLTPTSTAAPTATPARTSSRPTATSIPTPSLSVAPPLARDGFPAETLLRPLLPSIRPELLWAGANWR